MVGPYCPPWRVLGASLLVLAAGPATRAMALDGVVQHADGSPAADVEVSVVGRSGSVSTDPRGAFRVTPDPSFPCTFIVSNSRGEVFPPIDVGVAPTGVLELRLQEVLREIVTVVADAAPNIDSTPAAAKTLISQEDLQQRRPARLVDALESIPGASRLDEGASGVPVLRGLARGRTLLLYDGARVSAERRAGPSATFLDIFSLGSIEISRGPGSVAYGSDAFGGIIHAVPRDPIPGRKSLRYDVGVEAGGLRERTLGIEVTQGLFGGGALAQIRLRHADNSRAGGGGEVDNSSWEDGGAALRFVRDSGLGWWRLGFNLDRGRDIGKPAADSDLTRTFYPVEDSTRFTVALDSGPRAGWENIATSAYLGNYRLALDRDRLATSTVTRRIERSDVDADDGQLRSVASRELGGGRLQLGVDLSWRVNLRALTSVVAFDDGGTRLSDQKTLAINDASRTDAGLFAVWDRALGSRVALNLGVRGDQVRSKNTAGFFGDRSVTDSAFSGQAALTVGPFSGLSVVAQAARGFRAPLLSDRYFRGPSGRGFVTGNPGLAPETSDQVDLAVHWKRRIATVGVYAYRYKIDHLIERYRPANDFFFRNRGEAEIRGFELEAQAGLGARLQLQVGGAWARGEDADTREPLADVAAPGGWLVLRWQGSGLYGYLRWAAFVHDDRPGTAELARPGYATFDAGGGWQVSDAFEVRLIARNLSDKRYRGTADELATLAPGRSLAIALVGRR